MQRGSSTASILPYQSGAGLGRLMKRKPVHPSADQAWAGGVETTVEHVATCREARPKQWPSRRPRWARRCTFLAVVPRTEPSSGPVQPVARAAASRRFIAASAARRWARRACQRPAPGGASAQGNRLGRLAKRRQPFTNPRAEAVRHRSRVLPEGTDRVYVGGVEHAFAWARGETDAAPLVTEAVQRYPRGETGQRPG